jgi:hypothetical protein
MRRQHLLQLIVRQRRNDPTVGTHHGFCHHDRVDHGLLGGLNDGGKQRIQFPALDALHPAVGRRERRLCAVAFIGPGVGRGERQKNVARSVAFDRSYSPQPTETLVRSHIDTSDYT